MRSRSASMPAMVAHTSSFESVFIQDWLKLLNADAYQMVNPIYAWLNIFLNNNKKYYKNKESVKKLCDEFCQQLDVANLHLNQQTYYVVSSILNSEDLDMVKVMVDRWVKAAEKLHANGNYFSAYAVMVALQISYIERLYDKEKLPAALLKLYSIDKIISDELVKEIKNHKGSKVPMTTVLSSWMQFDKQQPVKSGKYKQTKETIKKIESLYQFQYEDNKNNSESNIKLSTISTSDVDYYPLSYKLLPKRETSTAIMINQFSKNNRRLVRVNAVEDIPGLIDDKKSKRQAGVYQWEEDPAVATTSTLTKK